MSRDSRLQRNMILSVVIKGGGFFVSLVLMRVYISLFDSPAALGVWFTLLAMLNWILTFDFGVGNGLRNRLVEALADGDEPAQRGLISTTYALSGTLSCLALLFSVTAVLLVDWNAFLNVHPNQIGPSSLRASILVVVIGICLQLVLKNVNSILYAMQMPSISNSTGLVTNVILLAGMLFIQPSTDQQAVVGLAWLYLFCTTLPPAVLTVWLFGSRLRHARPSVHSVSRASGSMVLRLGLGFFVLQLLSVMLFGSTEFIITRVLSPEYVVEYQMYNRLYNAFASIGWIALIPMWSAISEAYFVGDHAWIEVTFRRLSRAMLVVVFGLLGLTALLQVVFDVWLGSQSITVNYWYGFAFVVYYALYVWWGVIASFANGTGKIRTQTVCAVLGISIYLTGAILGANYTHDWIAIVWAGAAGMLVYAVVEPRNITRIVSAMRDAKL